LKELLSRIVVGFLLGAIIILASISRPIFLLLFLLIWLGIATAEFLHLLQRIGLKFNYPLFIAINLIFILLIHFNAPLHYLFFLIVIIFLWAIFQSPFSSKYFTYGLFSLFYLAFLPTHFLLLKKLVTENHLSNHILLFPLFFTWLNDTLAYGIGKGIGQRKLAEAISPQKTYEGFFGALTLSIPFSFFYLKSFLPKVFPLNFILLSVLLTILAQIGDLLESVFKREAKVKDSSNLLLGHGGFLDRIDSLLFTIPAFYYWLKVFF